MIYPMEYPLFTLSSGDVLHGTRYRLLKQMNILSRQQGQKAAWLASDAQSAARRVILVR